MLLFSAERDKQQQVKGCFSNLGVMTLGGVTWNSNLGSPEMSMSVTVDNLWTKPGVVLSSLPALSLSV